jgi:hypothetical protein
VQMSVFHRFLVHACVHVYKHAHIYLSSTSCYSASHAAAYVDRITCPGCSDLPIVFVNHAWSSADEHGMASRTWRMYMWHITVESHGRPARPCRRSIHVPAAHPHAVIYRNRHEGNDQTQQAAAATVISVFDPRDEHAARQTAWSAIRGIVPSITPLTSLAADGHATAQRRQACTCGFDLHVNAIMRVKRVRQNSTKSSSRTCRMLHVW